jgi:hypothetical protein
MASEASDEGFLGALAKALRETRIDAVIVGNVASILYGANVLTADVDILLRNTPLNRKKLRALATTMGGAGPMPISDLASDVQRIYGPDVPIDVIFDRIPGKLSFASVKSRARPHVFGTEVLTVAALADVIRSKQAAGRPKDVAVLPILHATLAARRELGLEPPAVKKSQR